MPSLSTLLLFILAALTLLLIPGPAVLYIVTRSAQHGRRAGLASVLGVEAAGLVHALAAALGLSAILLASATAFEIVKYAGAAYLVYLGVRTLLARDEPTAEAPRAETRLRAHFGRGMLVNLLNPKTALFFYAFLPQFVDPGKGGIQGQIFLLGVLFVLLASCTDGMYSLLASSVGRWLLSSTKVLRVKRYVSAGIYVALGLVTAVTGADRK
jgi:threonine/homoserine/homoserine lactone efflux protein